MSVLDTFQFPFIGFDGQRESQVEDLPDGTRKVMWIINGVADASSGITHPKGSACDICTEKRREHGDLLACAPLRLDGPFTGSYNIVSLQGIDLTKAICPLFSHENPEIVKKALNILGDPGANDASVARAVNMINKFPNTLVR